MKYQFKKKQPGIYIISLYNEFTYALNKIHNINKLKQIEGSVIDMKKEFFTFY